MYNKPGALEVVADSDAHVCLMHMKGDPHNMQDDPYYEDLLLEVREFPEDDIGISTCKNNGISAERVIIDIGFGFGKTPKET